MLFTYFLSGAHLFICVSNKLVGSSFPQANGAGNSIKKRQKKHVVLVVGKLLKY